MNDLNEDVAEHRIKDATEATLKEGDILEIHISSISQETNTYFYKPGGESDTKSGANTYQIAGDGKVDFPLIGRVTLKGKTPTEGELHLKELLAEYLQKPVVNIRLVNFSITVLGEVKTPGLYQVPSANANILEAMGLAGDMTIYGKRDKVLVVRNNGDDKRYFRVDLNQSNFFESEAFHLQNNDIVYVPPSRGRSSADDNVYRLLPLVISSLTFAVVIISLSQ